MDEIVTELDVSPVCNQKWRNYELLTESFEEKLDIYLLPRFDNNDISLTLKENRTYKYQINA